MEKNSLETDKYVEEQQLRLNAEKTALLYFSARDEVEPKITFKKKIMKSAESCRCLRILLDSKMSFDAHLNFVLRKRTAAIFSL